jgi:hypothetical protein
MKYNELIRPAGVGRKQVAFQTSTVPSVLSAAETLLNEEQTNVPNINTAVSIGAFSESAAYSAATAAQNEVSNFCFQSDRVTDFAFVGGPARFQFGRSIVTNPLITYDPRSQFFSCRKPGWYFVTFFVYFTGINANVDWSCALTPETTAIGSGVDEIHATTMDFNNVAKHCHLSGSALFNVPAQIDGDLSQGERRFAISITTTHTGLNVFTNSNTKVDCKIIYLGALPMSQRALTSAV